PGDEILVPAPDYPTWTGAVNLTGGVPVHYLADEANGWNPSLTDIEAKITPRTTALVLINPNNPTGAVYSEETVRGMADIARRHGLLLLSDEVYERLIFSGARHHHAALAAEDDVLCLTFGGLSKAYRVCGYRAGWVAATGPLDHASDLIEGLTLLANMRVCPNVPGQHAIPVARAEDSAGGADGDDPDGRTERKLPVGTRARSPSPRINSTPSRASAVSPRRVRCTASPASTARCSGSPATRNSSWTCCEKSTSWSRTAPGSTGPSRTTSGSSAFPVSR